MVADDVERVSIVHAGECVQELRLREPQVVAARLREGGDEASLGARVARGEQRDLVPPAHEPGDEQADDSLGAAVAAGRHGKPGRRENGHAQALAAVLPADQILRPPAHDIGRAHRRQVALSHLLHTYNPSLGPGRDLSLHPTRSSLGL